MLTGNARQANFSLCIHTDLLHGVKQGCAHALTTRQRFVAGQVHGLMPGYEVSQEGLPVPHVSTLKESFL